jgi:hypothetical protein
VWSKWGHGKKSSRVENTQCAYQISVDTLPGQIFNLYKYIQSSSRKHFIYNIKQAWLAQSVERETLRFHLLPKAIDPISRLRGTFTSHHIHTSTKLTDIQFDPRIGLQVLFFLFCKTVLMVFGIFFSRAVGRDRYRDDWSLTGANRGQLNRSMTTAILSRTDRMNLTDLCL